MKKIKILFFTLFVVDVSGVLILLTPNATATINTSATASLTVTNVAPTITVGPAATYLVAATPTAPPISLTAGDTETVTVTFTAHDDNGCADIDSAATKTTGKIFNPEGGSITSACTPSSTGHNCYALSCTQDGGSCTTGLTATYTCTASMQYYADATDGGTYSGTTWTMDIIPADNAGAATPNTTGTFTVTSMTALNVAETTIPYTVTTLGTTTLTTDQTTTITNKGNRIIDAEVKGYGLNSGDTTHSMSCTQGTIPIGNEKYTLAGATTTYASLDYTLTGTFVGSQITAFNLSPTTTGSDSTSHIYWGMALPANGVGGSCSGTVAFLAVNH